MTPQRGSQVRTYECDACGMVIDRDASAALNLAALAAAAVAGTGVAADQDIAPAVSKPRGADQKTRTTRPGGKARPGRAGGVIRSSGRKRETVLKPKRSCFGDVTDLLGRNARDAKSPEAQSNGADTGLSPVGRAPGSKHHLLAKADPARRAKRGKRRTEVIAVVPRHSSRVSGHTAKGNRPA